MTVCTWSTLRFNTARRAAHPPQPRGAARLYRWCGGDRWGSWSAGRRRTDHRGQVRRFLGESGCHISVQPVIDLQDSPPVDGYEIPRRIREAMFLRMPASCFPYAGGIQPMDLDHTKAYLPMVRGGPPGQTGIHRLGPLADSTIASKPTAAGRSDNPNPASGSGDPHTATTTSSPTPAPTTSATDPSPDESGQQRVWRAAAADSRPW
jgi:hypothetical protein